MKLLLTAALALVMLNGASLRAADAEDHGKTVAVTGKNWKQEVENSDKPVVVDFWATWCGPCMKLAPHVAALSKEMTNVKFAKVDVDASEDLATKFNVTVIPYLAVFSHGKKIAEHREGYMDPDQLKKFVSDAVSKAK